MAEKKSALIVGCGYVGNKLKEKLESNNWIVKGIKRTNSHENGMKSIDVSRPFDLNENFDFVFYMVSADTYDYKSYYTAYEIGVENTLKALSKKSSKAKFFFVSSTRVFSENNGSVVNENSATDKNSFAKKSLCKGEDLVRSSSLDYCIVRFSGIYGHNRFRLLNEFIKGNARLKENDYLTNRIHVDDCVGSLIHLSSLELTKNLYLCTDSEPAYYNEILIWLSKFLNKENLLNKDKDKSNKIRSNKYCSNKLLIESGYLIKFPSFREGIASFI